MITAYPLSPLNGFLESSTLRLSALQPQRTKQLYLIIREPLLHLQLHTFRAINNERTKQPILEQPKNTVTACALLDNVATEARLSQVSELGRNRSSGVASHFLDLGQRTPLPVKHQNLDALVLFGQTAVIIIRLVIITIKRAYCRHGLCHPPFFLASRPK